MLCRIHEFLDRGGVLGLKYASLHANMATMERDTCLQLHREEPSWWGPRAPPLLIDQDTFPGCRVRGTGRQPIENIFGGDGGFGLGGRGGGEGGLGGVRKGAATGNTVSCKCKRIMSACCNQRMVSRE